MLLLLLLLLRLALRLVRVVLLRRGLRLGVRACGTLAIGKEEALWLRGQLGHSHASEVCEDGLHISNASARE